MKFSTVMILCIGSAMAIPVGDTKKKEEKEASSAKVNWVGFPSNSLSCPNADGDNKASFSPDYMKQDIEASISLKKKKGYPTKFGTGHSGSSQFNFQNSCMERATGGNKEKIYEMPMIEGKSWADAGSNPGAFRVYFIRETNGDNDYTVTYCGAYGHTDNNDMGKFGACT